LNKYKLNFFQKIVNMNKPSPGTSVTLTLESPIGSGLATALGLTTVTDGGVYKAVELFCMKNFSSNY
jgi:hypothetical protein